jgi:hypothetical protein
MGEEADKVNPDHYFVDPGNDSGVKTSYSEMGDGRFWLYCGLRLRRI